MSLYAPGKQNVVSPEVFERIRVAWATEVDVADAIVVIGARPMLQSDPHVWDPIVKSEAPIAIIGGGVEPLQNATGARLTHLGTTFEAAFDPLRDWISHKLEQSN